MFGLAMMLTAATIPTEYLSGDRLYKLCTGGADDRRLCSAYLTGVMDAVSAMPQSYVCVIGDPTGQRLRQIYVAYVAANPDGRLFSGGDTAVGAFRESFPCRKGG